MSSPHASGHLHVSAESKAPYDAATLATLREDAAAVVARYPQKRSALLPLLHLVQSVDGYVTGRGIEFCAETLELTTADVSGVATFYTQFKRHPNGDYTVGVCTNTLCAVMGGDHIWDTVSEHLGVGHDETTGDGKITLERIECNAACDYAPVVMVNWEFFDNQTPSSAQAVVDALRAGESVVPTRGASKVCTFKEVSRVLAGFADGRANEGVGAGEASLRGTLLAREMGWTAPAMPGAPTPPAQVAQAAADSAARSGSTSVSDVGAVPAGTAERAGTVAGKPAGQATQGEGGTSSAAAPPADNPGKEG